MVEAGHRTTPVGYGDEHTPLGFRHISDGCNVLGEAVRDGVVDLANSSVKALARSAGRFPSAGFLTLRARVDRDGTPGTRVEIGSGALQVGEG